MKKALVISVVGSGGKTTFIRQTAEKVKKRKKQAAIVTTTHMWIPSTHCILKDTWEEAVKMLEEEGIVYFGKAAEEEGKMVFPGREVYEKLCGQADVVLVEADGAKAKPMKIPDWSREPVIPENTDKIVVLFGLSALGKPLEEVCHRWGLGKNWIKNPGGKKESGAEQECRQEIDGIGQIRVDRELAGLFLRRGYLDELEKRFPEVPVTVLLNQADNQERRNDGIRIKKYLTEKGTACEVVQMKEKKNPPIAVIYMASGFGKRFGGNKLLEKLEGKALYLYGLEKLMQWQKGYGQAEIVLVSQYDEILEYGRRQEGMICVKNLQAAEGITASLRLGLEAAGEADYYLFSVADQPGLKQETLERFIREFLEEKERYSMGCLCTKEGGGGNPVIFHRCYREELLALRGDKGGSRVMKRYPGEVFRFYAGEEELRDIDRVCDIRNHQDKKDKSGKKHKNRNI